jgi:hypothetical protein
MIRQIAEAHKLLNQIKDAHSGLQGAYERRIMVLQEIIEEKEKAINDLNASLFKVTQESMDKDKTIEALAEQVKELNLSKENKLFLLDDEGAPIKSFTLTGKLVLMEEPAEEKLEVGKWYDARTFEVEKLKELLPVGTKVAIIPNSWVDEEEVINEEEHTHITNVTKVVEEYNLTKNKKQTVIYADIYPFVPNNWFKIIKE